MTCAQGFCVPAETPQFAASCIKHDSSSNMSALTHAPSNSIASTQPSSAEDNFAHIGSGRAAAPGNGGVPLEVIVLVKHGRQLHAEVRHCRKLH